LRPATFFPPVVPLRAAGLGRLHRLAVQDAGRRRRLLAGQHPDVGPEGGVDPLPDALIPPGVEVVRHRLPRREVVGQHPPTGPAPGQVQDGVDDLPQGVGAGPAGGPIALRKEVFDVVPLEVGEITRVSLPCGDHAGRVAAPRRKTESQFLDGQ
jgi:hypothetical protein